MTTYKMDDATFRHVTAFCDSFFAEDKAEGARDKIVSTLESWPVEDAEYSLNHGWRHIVDLLEL